MFDCSAACLSRRPFVPPSPSPVQARLEPPLPLLCSQPGSSVAKYSTLKDQLSRLQQAAAVLERGQARCLHVFSSPSNEPAAAAAVAEVQAALSGAAALVAAACAGAAEALGHMPALAPCSGPALSWRPLPAAAWVEASASVADAARSLAASYQEAFQRDGLDFALSLAVEEVGEEGGGRGA